MTSINAAAASTVVPTTGQPAVATAQAADGAAFQAVLMQQAGTPPAQTAKAVVAEAETVTAKGVAPEAVIPALAEWLEALAQAGLSATTTTAATTGQPQTTKTTGQADSADADPTVTPAANDAVIALAALSLSIPLPTLPDPKLELSTGVAAGAAQATTQTPVSNQPLDGATVTAQTLGTVLRNPGATLDLVLRGAAMQPVNLSINPSSSTIPTTTALTETTNPATSNQPATAAATTVAAGVSLGKSEAAEPLPLTTQNPLAVVTGALTSAAPLTTAAVAAGRTDAASAAHNPGETIEHSEPTGQAHPSGIMQVAGGKTATSNESNAAKTQRVTAGAAVKASGDSSAQQSQSNMQEQTVTNSTATSTPSAASETALSLSETQREAVISQISDAVLRAAARRPSEVRIRLDPPELGSLNIKIISHRGGLEVQLGAASESVRSMLETHITSLRAALADQGMSQANLNVFVGGQGQQFDQGRLDQRNATQQAAQQARKQSEADIEAAEARMPVFTARADGLDYRA